jgi:hypothetical protein
MDPLFLVLLVVVFGLSSFGAHGLGRRFLPSRTLVLVVSVTSGVGAVVFAVGVRAMLLPPTPFGPQDAPRLWGALEDGCLRWCGVEGADRETCGTVCTCAAARISRDHPNPPEFVQWFSGMTGQDRAKYLEWMAARGECSREFMLSHTQPTSSSGSGHPTNR